MDKKIIYEYLDAKKLAEETEVDLRKVQTVIQDKVYGSNPEFPYQGQSFTITGVVERTEKSLLIARKENAERIRLEAEELINTAPVRIQRIIRFKIMQGQTWQEVAEKMGGKSTENSVKKEFQRWMKEK